MRHLLLLTIMISLPAAAPTAGDRLFRTMTAPPSMPVGPGAIAVSGQGVVLVQPDGQVRTWGRHAGRTTEMLGVTAVAAGPRHTLVVSWDGHVYTFGSHHRGLRYVDGLDDVLLVAAGRDHSLALTADGRVFAWGDNDRGQLGLGSRRRESRPRAVSGLPPIVAVAAGDDHSLALSADGALFAWGANRHGQLGNGSRRDRVAPVRLTALAGVTAIAAGTAHSVALIEDGSVYTWGVGSRGQLGNGSRRSANRPRKVGGLNALAIAAGGNASAAVNLDGSLLIWGSHRTRPEVIDSSRAVSAFAVGDDRVVAVTTPGDVWTWVRRRPTRALLLAGVPDWGPPIGAPAELPAPSIVPPGGSHATAQMVTIEGVASPAVVRYTVDDSDPTPAAQLYEHPIHITTATNLRVRAFAPDGSAGPVASATFSFRYGTLPEPVAAPRGGDVAAGTTVTLTSLPGATIRFTLDGLAPIGDSAVYTAPVPLGETGGVLTARAFHPDWDPSPVVVETYTIDAVPPSITAAVVPSAVNGWHTGPVSISFACNDDRIVLVCPEPVLLSTDGAGQLVSGVARDAAGNEAVASVTIHLDQQGPRVELQPVPDEIAAAWLPITAAVADDVSEVVQASCNGVEAAVQDGRIDCLVPLRDGRNPVVVVAADLAGNLTSQSVVAVRRSDEAVTALAVTPMEAAMLVGETRGFSAVDDRGRQVAAVWESSDPSVLMIVDGMFVAVAPGTADITARHEALMAQATVTVHAGPFLPAGTARWELPPPAAFAEGDLVFPEVRAGDDPAVLSVDFTDDGRVDPVVRALTTDGALLWTGSLPVAPEEWVMPVIALPGGGAVTTAWLGAAQSIVRADWSAAAGSWRRPVASDAEVVRVMPGIGGTLFAYQVRVAGGAITSPEILGLDEQTGAIKFRISLPVFTRTVINAAGTTTVFTFSSTGPQAMAVSSAGDLYLVETAGSETIGMGHLYEPVISLVRITPAGAVTRDGLWERTGNFFSGPHAGPAGQLVADGNGHVLLPWLDRADWLATPVFSAIYAYEGTLARFGTDGLFVPQVTTVERVAIGRLGWGGPLTALDLTTGAPLWSAAEAGEAILGTAGGGAVITDGAGSFRVIGTGVATTPDLLGIPAGPYQFGRFHARLDSGALRAVPWRPLDDVTAASRISDGRNAYGIFARAHELVGPLVSHVALRLVPRYQAYWSSPDGSPFVKRDAISGDLLFATIGAGPVPDSMLCLSPFAKLTGDVNREQDWQKAPNELERLPVLPDQENAAILTLFERLDAFPNDLDYECTPTALSDGYNSNSFAAGILLASQIRLPIFPIRTLLRYPGWNKPVPAWTFGVSP